MPRIPHGLHPLLVCVSWFALATAVHGSVIDVPGDHGTVASALNAARPGDMIEIQPGVYPASGLEIPAGVVLRGMGTDASDVVLDGQGRGRILTASHLTARTTIQNLTFRGGRADGETVNLSSGGALFIVNSDMVIQNCYFTGNAATAHGGAVRNVDSSARFSQCVFANNTAAEGGGAIDVSYGSSPAFFQCVFRENRAAWGGGVSNRGGAAPEFTGCRFVANAAADDVGFGGAVYADVTARPSFEGCTFESNMARYGGAVGAFQGSGISIEKSTLVDNGSGVRGGGVFCVGSSPQIISSLLVDNRGGGIAVHGESMPLVACAGFHGNTDGAILGEIDGASEGIYEDDPAFCTSDDGFGTRFHLSGDSPYADAFCGLLGAWTAGCAPEIDSVSGFSVNRENNRLLVRWSGDPDSYNQWFRLTWTANRIEREVVFARSGDGAFTGIEFLPSGTKADIRVRLYVRTSDDEWALLQDTGGDLVPDLPPATGIPLRAWPNPFNPQTTVAFEMPSKQRTRVTIHDLQGRLVRVLLDATLPEGPHQEPWNGRDHAGRIMAAGVYVVRVQGEDAESRLKITLLK